MTHGESKVMMETVSHILLPGRETESSGNSTSQGLALWATRQEKKALGNVQWRDLGGASSRGSWERSHFNREEGYGVTAHGVRQDGAVLKTWAQVGNDQSLNLASATYQQCDLGASQ